MQKTTRRLNAYKLVLIIITLVFLVFMLSGITLSFDNNIGLKQVDAIVFNVGDLAINYIDGNKIDLKYPTKKKYEYSFSVTNTGSNKVYYAIYLKDASVVKENIKYHLLDDNKKELKKEKLKNGENLLQSVITIEPNTTDRYTLVIDNKRNRTDIKGLITIENESINKNTLQDLILSDNYFNTNSKTEIGKKAIEDEGLIKTTDDYGTSYYFRGNVSNNHLLINNKAFRIIRINGDGTIRAIFDEGDSLEAAFNTNEDENVENLALLEKSTIINILNAWSKDNLGDYEDLLVASSFCSDKDFSTIRENKKYSSTHERTVSNNYTLKCFTTSYLSKVGFISADEVILAGGSTEEENVDYYLYNSNIEGNTWTMSSNSISEDNTLEMFTLTNTGLITSNAINIPLHLRPVINISSSAIAKGEGTEQNPYLIVK